MQFSVRRFKTNPFMANGYAAESENSSKLGTCQLITHLKNKTCNFSQNSRGQKTFDQDHFFFL